MGKQQRAVQGLEAKFNAQSIGQRNLKLDAMSRL